MNSPLSPEDASDQLSTADAMIKQSKGQAISSRERVAIDRFRLRVFMEMANSMKQKHLAEIMGVHSPVLNQLETDFGLPTGSGRQTWSLISVLAGMRDILKRNKKRILAEDESDKVAARKIELDVLKAEQAVRKLELENAKSEGSILDREVMDSCFQRLTTELRSLGDR